MPVRALLLDVGGVLIWSNWHTLTAFAIATGRPVPAQGPLDPAGDPLWQRHLSGDISIDEYWDAQAVANGFPDRRPMFGAINEELQGDLFADDTLALIDQARSAGIPVGILSNDLVAASGREFVDSRPELDVDVFVDATEFGVRKPAPEIYLEAASRFGLDPAEVVLLDDTPECVAGAEAVGMVAIEVDPLDHSPALRSARALLGLNPLHEVA
jgi:FMN phosphatase YigB (HAD superfamily)